MVFYLLPWSKKRSSVDTVKRDLIDVWKEGIGNRFSELDPLRGKIIETFKVRTHPLTPVWRRYKGRFWEELSFWALPKKVQERIEERGIVPSPLFGVLGVGDLIPNYELTWDVRFLGKTLRSFWRRELRELLFKLFDDATVFDFLSSDRSVFSFPDSTKRITFEYYRKGMRVRNPLPHRAYTLRYIAEKGIDPEELWRVNFLDYKIKDMQERGREIKVILQSEGNYV